MCVFFFFFFFLCVCVCFFFGGGGAKEGRMVMCVCVGGGRVGGGGGAREGRMGSDTIPGRRYIVSPLRLLCVKVVCVLNDTQQPARLAK